MRLLQREIGAGQVGAGELQVSAGLGGAAANERAISGYRSSSWRQDSIHTGVPPRMASRMMLFPVPFSPVIRVTGAGSPSGSATKSIAAASKGPMFFRSRA